MAKAFHEAQKKYSEVKKKYDEQNKLPIGGKSSKMGESLFGNRKAAEKAYDTLQNMREEEMEVQKERMHPTTRSLNKSNDKDTGATRRDNKSR